MWGAYSTPALFFLLLYMALHHNMRLCFFFLFSNFSSSFTLHFIVSAFYCFCILRVWIMRFESVFQFLIRSPKNASLIISIRSTSLILKYMTILYFKGRFATLFPLTKFCIFFFITPCKVIGWCLVVLLKNNKRLYIYSILLVVFFFSLPLWGCVL